MKTLHDLNDKELKELYDKNKDLQNLAWQDALNESGEAQNEEFNLMGADVFEYFNYYSSFYLKTPTLQGAKAPEKVAGKLDRDYLTPENAKLYDKLCELTEKWNAIDYDDQDEDSELYQDMIKTCDELAEGITEQLRAYDDIDDDYAYDLFKQNAYDGYMSDWEVNEKGEVIETIYKTYK